VTLVGIAQLLPPGRHRGVALGSAGSAAAGSVALVVIRIHAARVIGVIVALVEVADQ